MTIQTFSANKLLIAIFNLLFSKRTWKIAFVLLALTSIYTSYYFAKQIYNFHCSAGGYLVKKTDCDTFAQAKFYVIENDRLERVNEELQNNKYTYGQ